MKKGQALYEGTCPWKSHVVKQIGASKAKTAYELPPFMITFTA